MKEHWEKVYQTKQPNEVSWTQAIPQTSLDFIKKANLEKDAAIIDIGGGDSNLVDFLLDDGYNNVTVLDISAAALERAKLRLGDRSSMVNWVESDITQYQPDRTFDFWHDRAAFHFLTTLEQVQSYNDLVNVFVTGHLSVGTFSENGPKKCSGLDIKQYSKDELSSEFSSSFNKLECITEDHQTPFNTTQNFTFCFFERR
jgi:SAM-dependent methyltransferase